jgi:hypothetical protein
MKALSPVVVPEECLVITLWNKRRRETSKYLIFAKGTPAGLARSLGASTISPARWHICSNIHCGAEPPCCGRLAVPIFIYATFLKLVKYVDSRNKRQLLLGEPLSLLHQSIKPLVAGYAPGSSCERLRDQYDCRYRLLPSWHRHEAIS